MVCTRGSDLLSLVCCKVNKRTREEGVKNALFAQTLFMNDPYIKADTKYKNTNVDGKLTYPNVTIIFVLVA